MLRRLVFILLLPAFIFSCKKDNSGPEITTGKLGITYIYIGGSELSATGENNSIELDKFVQIRFDKAVNSASAEQNISLMDADKKEVGLTFTFFSQNQLIQIEHPELKENSTYTLTISGELKGANDETFDKQTITFKTLTSPLILESVLIDGKQINPQEDILDISRNPEIEFHFNLAISKNDFSLYSSFTSGGSGTAFNLDQLDEKSVLMTADQTLEGLTKCKFSISPNIETKVGRPFEGLNLTFYTRVDSSYKFPEISDNELLTLVQQQTFKYFWDFGHPVSGLARERDTSGETVTIGGSGFGLMAIIVGVERGFISRSEGLERLQTIVDFLGRADRFHGAWPHWLNGTTGKVKPFSAKDDGGDLVETSYMAAGLLAVRQYLDPGNSDENTLIGKINDLWNSIEWDWFTRGGQNTLYWHWSPDYNWDMNMKIQGYNEALITYIMAASSTTHSISANVYHEGWAQNGAIKNGNEFYGITLPVGQNYGGPLFFAHYTFLGIDPQNLSDKYANYWDQNRDHTLINRAYCIDNPNNFAGYSKDCWGLTASDGYFGYSAHSPTNDKGVISPTAAVSSIPYTPEESMDAIRFFYYILGDKLWGEYGFYDAFDFTNGWVADSYLAIDQGPIIVMIENYRTGLVWDLLMSCPEIQAGLTKLGFTY